MKTCKTCKFWNIDFKIKNSISDCNRPFCLPDLKNNVTIKIISSSDDNKALLMTGKDFSCLHHTIKQKD